MAEETTRLYDSTICRFCAENNENGEPLFGEDQDDPGISLLINRYLPLKVHDDGKLPKTICPGCNIQLDATIQFFELLINGQNKLREMLKWQQEEERRLSRELSKAGLDLIEDNYEMDEQIDETEDEPIILQIMPDGTMYAAEHEISLQMEGLDKPRRKRGRPPKSGEDKSFSKDESQETRSQDEDSKQEDDSEEIDGDGRRRRKRKTPKRFMEAVQGKELDRIFKEEGALEGEAALREKNSFQREEIIGHMESQEGKDLGELIVMNRAKGRGRTKVKKRLAFKFSCKLCFKGFISQAKYDLHMANHKPCLRFKCMECKFVFNSKEELASHQVDTLHNGMCTTRVQQTANNELIEIEDKIEVNKKLVESSSEVLDRKENLPCTEPSSSKETEVQESTSADAKESDETSKSEQEVIEDSKDSFTCYVCDKHFQIAIELKTHMNTEHNLKTEKGYPCDICGKVLNHPSSIVYHKEAEHNDGRRFVCNRCDKSFKHKQLLQRHQLVHSSDRPHVCKSCDATFKTKANLLNHQSTHTGEKKYTCDICGQQFAHKTSLTLHYRWHAGHKPFVCKICGKSFSQNGNLQEHTRIHTGEKPYSCTYCERKFTTSSQFKLHVKRHTGERPWKCEFCAKTFLHKDTWKCHVRRHKGERPFQCNYCNRGFTEQWALKKHVRLHTGEKPYSCDICQKAFADCSNLTKHKKVHKDKEPIEPIDAPAMEEVWQIIPGAVEDEDQPFNNDVAEISEDDMQQVIYVSYQDPNTLNQSKTLQFVGTQALSSNQPVAKARSQIFASMIDNSTITPDLESNEHEEDLEKSNIQLQITDEKGNPISLSLQEARHLLLEKHFMSQLNDGQTIKISSDLLTDELAKSLNVTMSQHAADAIDHHKLNQDPDNSQDSNEIVKVLEGEEGEEDANVSQVSTDAVGTGEEQTIEFTTQDGQKVRLVASYNVDPMQSASEYLTIV